VKLPLFFTKTTNWIFSEIKEGSYALVFVIFNFFFLVVMLKHTLIMDIFLIFMIGKSSS
jgi:hypothetical protein